MVISQQTVAAILVLARSELLFVDNSLPRVAAAGLTLADSLWLTTMQTQLPEYSISKVSSYDWAGSVVPAPLGYAVGGLVAAAGVAGAALVAVLIVLTRLLSLSFAEVRGIRAGRADEPITGR